MAKKSFVKSIQKEDKPNFIFFYAGIDLVYVINDKCKGENWSDLGRKFCKDILLDK
jgi:hypothetical protein